jgi:putative ABC transport system ATP-binding protein
MKDTILNTTKVSRHFSVAQGEDFIALNQVSLSIKKGSLSILRGRSGSGKTTLLNILGALDRPTSGNVEFDGQDITRLSEKQREWIRRTKIGFIFQSVSLIPIMTAYENVEFALRLSGYQGDRKQRVEESLKLVGLSQRMHHMPQELSGGEQQRVAIARAIAHRPAIIFADEPTAELDSASALNVMKIFRELVEKENVTIVMTTHDMGLMDASDAIFMLKDGELANE